MHVHIADQNLSGAQSLAHTLGPLVTAHELDVTSWSSQVSAFSAAVQQSGGRIDYVYAIAGVGERAWLPALNASGPPTAATTSRDEKSTEYAKPDLTTLDVDLTGLLYTIGLAVQQFRRQTPDPVTGYRGRIAVTASVCGFYAVPTLPIYTAAKHAVVGLVRSYGVYLQQTEGVTLNAVCPNVVRTNISSGAFYDGLEAKGLLTGMAGVLEAFGLCMGDGKESDGDGGGGGGGPSGVCYEVGPRGGVQERRFGDYVDEETGRVCELLYHRALPLQTGETRM